MRVWRLRAGISVTVSPADRRKLKAVVSDRNAAQKHAWRAAIVLLTADGVGTNELLHCICRVRASLSAVFTLATKLSRSTWASD